MTGFDQKVMHLAHECEKPVWFVVEVDFLGNGSWVPYATVGVGPNGYSHHEFPVGFSAHWVRLSASRDCTATAYFHYT